MSAQQAEAAAVMEAAEKFSRVEVIDLGTQKVLSVPHGRTVVSTKKFEDERRFSPERRQGTATFEELTSFVAWTRRFADEDSVIFADVAGKAPKLTAVIDYHRKTAEGLPRFGQHRGVYTFPIADEWKRWTTLGELSQADSSRSASETCSIRAARATARAASRPSSASDSPPRARCSRSRRGSPCTSSRR